MTPHGLDLGGATDELTSRTISDSEIGTLLACPARWDFRYGGRIAGTCVDRLHPALMLREGKAWGAAVAAFHGEPGPVPVPPLHLARKALREALAEDAKAQVEAGVYLDVEHAALLLKLDAILAHYATTSGRRLHVIATEVELRVPLPGGEVFHGFIDALARDDNGRLWIVEFKLRDNLTTFADIVRMPQTRRYAWAWGVLHPDDPIVGVIVDERVNGYPAEVRFNNDGTPSKVQSCSPDEYAAAFDALPRGEANVGKRGGLLKTQTCHPDVYVAACLAHAVDADPEVVEALTARYSPDPEVLAQLAAKAWQARHEVIFDAAELADTGADLASAADLIGLYDSGRLRPLRNPHRSRCGSCMAREVCDDPTGDLAAFYRLVPAKRDRPPLAPITPQED